MDFNPREFQWVEKYRPHKLDDCILPESMLKPFRKYVKEGEVPNMLLCGQAGVGKTSLAKAVCEEIGCDWLLINSAEESGIDVLRVKIKQFASTVSMEGKPKVVILDEADRATPAFQDAAKAFFEEFSNNCRFILTSNHKAKIIAPIHSRIATIEFKLASADKPKMAARFMTRLKAILANEGVEYDEKVVAKLLMKYFPDYRKVLMALQHYAASGSIDVGILAQIQETDIQELMGFLKEKNFKNMRQWVANNTDVDFANMIAKIYKEADKYVAKASFPALVMLLGEYDYKAAFVNNQEINTVALLTAMMADLDFV